MLQTFSLNFSQRLADKLAMIIILIIISSIFSSAVFSMTSKEYCNQLSTKVWIKKCETELHSIDFVNKIALKSCSMINSKDKEKINCLRSVANKDYTPLELKRCSRYLDGYLALYTSYCFGELGSDYQNGKPEYKAMEVVSFGFDKPIGIKAMCNTLPPHMCSGDCYLIENNICTAHY